MVNIFLDELMVKVLFCTLRVRFCRFSCYFSVDFLLDFGIFFVRIWYGFSMIAYAFHC